MGHKTGRNFPGVTVQEYNKEHRAYLIVRNMRKLKTFFFFFQL